MNNCYLCTQLLTKVDSYGIHEYEEKYNYHSISCHIIYGCHSYVCTGGEWFQEVRREGRLHGEWYAAPFEPQYFKSDAPKKMYANFPAGIHSMYIGEVINAWKK